MSDLEREGRPWSGEDDDRLLMLWIDEHQGERYVAEQLGRPIETVRNRVWKLATGYQSCRDYEPGELRQRNPKRKVPFSRREKQIIELGLRGEGGKRRNAVDLQFIANLLWRSLTDILTYEDNRLKLDRKGFFEE
jgi:hypothetical protein